METILRTIEINMLFELAVRYTQLMVKLDLRRHVIAFWFLLLEEKKCMPFGLLEAISEIFHLMQKYADNSK